MRWLLRIANIVDSAALGHAIDLIRANRQLAKKLKAMSIDSVSVEDALLALPQETLESFLHTDIDRILRIEDKARSNLVGVSTSAALVGVAVGFFTSNNLFTPEDCVVRSAAALCAVLSLAFLLISSMLAVQAYSVAAIAQPGMEDSLPSASKEELKRVLLYCIHRNRLTATQKGNFLFVSLRFIQNGTVLIGLWGVLALFAAMS